MSAFIVSLLAMVNSGVVAHADSSVSFSVNNNSTVLELTLPSSVTLDLVPNSTNNYVSFGSTNLSVAAGTNNRTGLTLIMSVPNTNLTNSGLSITDDDTHNPNDIPLDNSNHPIIPTLASGSTYTENTFATNAWGYKLSTNTNYSSVPSSLELLNTDSAHNAITTTLNLAAKVDSTRPAGTYSTTLTYTVVANVSKTYMQNISESDLASLMPNVGDEVTLYDSRDEKAYTVAKLPDGNYWMTQNLDHDIDSSRTYTPSDTDVKTNWTPTTSTYATNSSTWQAVAYPHINPESYDPGDVCWDKSNDYGTIASATENCGSDRHYHVGNYYNWSAAVASNDTSDYGSYYMGEENLPDTSICPAGWGLPRAGAGSDTVYGLLAYNNYYITNYHIDISASPYYFTPIDGYNNGLALVGQVVGYWEAASYNTIDAYRTHFLYDDHVDDYDYYYGETEYRSKGLPVRCVARPLTTTLVGANGEEEEEEEDDLIMQDVQSWGEDLFVGDVVFAMDIRDGKYYPVSRLADGNIWMLNNLDHNIGDIDGGVYTPYDTDIPDDWEPDSSEYTHSTNDTDWRQVADPITNPESYDPGDLCWSGEPGDGSVDECGQGAVYRLGNYYNWTAAVAMSDSSAYEDAGDIVDQSICPAGWTLPTAGPETGSGSYQNLITAYDYDSSMMRGSYTMWGEPLYFPLSSEWYGDLPDVGYGGRFWSSVVIDSDNSFDFLFDMYGNAYPDNGEDRGIGFSVRCVARNLEQ